MNATKYIVVAIIALMPTGFLSAQIYVDSSGYIYFGKGPHKLYQPPATEQNQSNTSATTVQVPRKIKTYDTTRRLFIAGVPQNLIFYGVRLDAEMPLTNKRKWWYVLAPQVYYHRNFESLQWRDYDLMRGFMADVYLKKYLNNNKYPVGMYVGFGAALGYLSYQRQEPKLKIETIDGVTYYRYQYVAANMNQLITSGKGYLGGQTEITRNVLMDFGVELSANYASPNIFDGENFPYELPLFIMPYFRLVAAL